MQAYKNEILLGKVLSIIQSRLMTLETSAFESLSKQAEDEAIKLTLELASYPPPPIPLYNLDDKYKDAEKLADVVDDIFTKVIER